MKQKYSLPCLALSILFLIYGSILQAQNANPLIHSTQFLKPVRNGGTKDFTPPKDAVEDISKRTIYSSTWKTKEGKVYVRYSSVMINYPDANGKLQPVDVNLKSSPRGWVADKQPNTCYFNADRSTAINLGKDNEIVFNKNVTINSMPFDQHITSMVDNDVKIDLSSGVHKELNFVPNGIKTDYVFDSPLEGGITVNEEVEFPERCILEKDGNNGIMKQGGWEGDYVLLSADGKQALARFQAAECYDAKKHWCFATYSLEKREGKNILVTKVPTDWLATAVYPVTVDPLVIGPTSNWTGGSTPSCLYPNFSTDSILVTIPPKITITYFTVDYAYVSNVTGRGIPINDGIFYFGNSCARTDTISCDHPGDTAGICYLVPYEDFHNPFTCCYAPSCSSQSFWLYAYLSRRAGGVGCDTDFIWYSKGYYKGFQYYFSAWLEGYTDSLVKWSVTPTTACSNNCSLTLKATAEYGVPPYTFTHPWATGNIVTGLYTTCLSQGDLTMNLTIPRPCPYTCGNIDSISVPPPIVVDACGDTATPGKPYELIINPVPVISVHPDTVKVCSGFPITLNMSSCVSGTNFYWTGSDNTTGSGFDTLLTDNTADTGSGKMVVNYTITGSVNGCNGDTLNATGIIYPYPVITISGKDSIIIGSSDTLKAKGGGSYQWTPSYGLSCTNCPNPIASPTVTTTYTLTVIDSGGCERVNGFKVNVIDNNITIPNVFTPNGDGTNDFFTITNLQDYPGSTLVIFDRWGKQVYSSTNYQNNWNGGGQSDGVYYYILSLTTGKKYKGYIQLIK